MGASISCASHKEKIKQMLLFKQSKVSPKRGMPVDLTNVARKVNDISSETVQLLYSTWTALASDAWQAVWVSVLWKLAYSSVLDANWFKLGSLWDSSLSFTSTALTTEIAEPDCMFEAMDDKTILETLKLVTSNLTDGQYIVDYRNWIIYGKKASDTTTLTSTAYKINSLLITATV